MHNFAYGHFKKISGHMHMHWIGGRQACKYILAIAILLISIEYLLGSAYVLECLMFIMWIWHKSTCCRPTEYQSGWLRFFARWVPFLPLRGSGNETMFLLFIVISRQKKYSYFRIPPSIDYRKWQNGEPFFWRASAVADKQASVFSYRLTAARL